MTQENKIRTFVFPTWFQGEEKGDVVLYDLVLGRFVTHEICFYTESYCTPFLVQYRNSFVSSCFDIYVILGLKP